MSTKTFFNLDINNVIGPDGESRFLDMTTCISLESLKEELAIDLKCEVEELDFSECDYSAESDFLIEFLKLENQKEPNDDVFDNITAIEDSNISIDVIEAAYNLRDSSSSVTEVISHAEENYIGQFNSESDFSEHYCEHYMEIEIPSILQGCIDWDRVWNSSLRHDHSESNNHYFRD